MPERKAQVQGGASPVEHVEDCPAERGDCTCGGYVPLSVAEGLAEALERAEHALSRVVDGTLHRGRNLAYEYVAAYEALTAYREAHPKPDAATQVGLPGDATTSAPVSLSSQPADQLRKEET